jgi:uncharacterized repeat protein (TIGR03803 family)
MQRSCLRFVPALVLILFLLPSTVLNAQTESVLYSFGQNGDSGEPIFPPTVGSDGSLYGIVGNEGALWLYQLTQSQDGTWNFAIIVSLLNSSDSGPWPLVTDPAGNLYGETWRGGEYDAGTVFELSPSPTGWTQTTLHNFSFTGKDGNSPSCCLMRDSSGNLYGTTNFGGGSDGCENNGCGTAFELSPTTGGGWSESILHAFRENDDGNEPSGCLTMDATGNLYGTTQFGGNGVGIVFELTPANGSWKEKILHRFSNNGKDGYSPLAGLALDSHGNLFGVANGGAYAGGTVFELSPTANGGWGERVIHNFGSGNDLGPDLLVDLLVDSAGNLYGTSYRGGLYYAGDVFELSPSVKGSWKETRLHNFDDVDGSDGTNPQAGLVFGPSGVLYGVTFYGGTYNSGTVFEVIP